jgi:glycine cleavage system H lipoate-binding protein
VSVILLLLTVVVFIVLELVRSSRKKVGEHQNLRSVEAPPPMKAVERYFHPAHSWIMTDKADVVTVGVDDFAQRMIGTIETIDLPALGCPLTQGQILATLRRGDKALAQVSPVSGVVVAVNDKLVSRPILVNESPYDRGWIVKLSPASLHRELRNLLKGVVAERWEEAVRAELVRWFTPRLGTVLQDGGGVIENVSDLLNDKEWERLVHEFFPVVAPNLSIRIDDLKEQRP